jgi:ribosomal protein L40E
MFNNIGKKVKGLAIVVCVIGMNGSLVGAIILWANELVGAGFSTLIGGCLSAWIGSWVTYCVGDTNAKLTEMQAEIDSIRQNASKQDGASPTDPGNAVAAPVKTQAEIHAHAARPAAVRVTEKGTNMLVCPGCGAKNPESRDFCMKCGSKL